MLNMLNALQWRNSQGAGAVSPQETSHREISADLLRKEREGKKVKWRRKEGKPKRGRWKIENGRRKVTKSGEDLFCLFVCLFVCFFVCCLFFVLFCFLFLFLFCFVFVFVCLFVCLFVFFFGFHFSNHWNLFRVYQNGNFLPGKSFSRREKIQEINFAHSEKNFPFTPLMHSLSEETSHHAYLQRSIEQQYENLFWNNKNDLCHFWLCK